MTIKKTSPSSPRIVVLGGSGFIGSTLIDDLWTKGYRNIVNISLSKYRTDKEIEQIESDVYDESSLNEFISEDDFVFHLAESMTPATSEIDRRGDIIRSLAGTIRLLDVCVKKKIRKIIFSSSGGTVYGTGTKPFKESDPTDPENSYGALKLATEKYIVVYGHLYRLDHAILRISNIYGRRDLGKKQPALDIFLEKISANKTITVNGDGSVIRDYIHVKDVADFMILSIEDKSVRGVYNVGTGIGTSLNDLIMTIEKTILKLATIEHAPAKRQDSQYNILDITRALDKGWKPKIGLEEGILELYNSINRGK